MKIRQYRPTSPGRRKASVLLKLELTKKPPEKSLIEPKKKTGGRNANGRITTRHHGGGAKRKYRIVDFKRKKDDVPAVGWKGLSVEFRARVVPIELVRWGHS